MESSKHSSPPRTNGRAAVLALLALALLAFGVIGVLAFAGGDPPPLNGENGTATQPPAPGPSEPEPPPAATTVRVHVEATPRRRFEAPATLPFTAVDAIDGTGLPVTAIAGTGAVLLDVDRRPGQALLRVERGGDRALVRVVAVADPEAPAPIEIGADVVVRGVVRGANGAPVAGARVWAGELLAGAIAGEAETDGDGAFAVTAAAGAGVPLTVRAEGHAFSWRAVTAANGTEFDFTLAPECVLDVLLAALAEGIEDARVFALPVEATTELLRFPFFLFAVTGGAPADADGRAVIRGLPRDAEVYVSAVHPRAFVEPSPKTRRLAGASAKAALPLHLLPAVAGRAVGADGTPLAHALVVCRGEDRAPRAGDAARRLLPPAADAWGCAVAVTAADGTFAVGARPGVPSTLSVRAVGHAWVDVAVKVAADERLALGDVVCPAWRGGPLELRVPSPVTAGAWSVRLGGGPWSLAEGTAPVALPLPHAGTWDVTVRVERAGVIGDPRTFAGIAVTGPTELPADAVR